MAELKTEEEQARDRLLLRLLKMPPQPRPQRKRSEGKPSPASAKRAIEGKPAPSA